MRDLGLLLPILKYIAKEHVKRATDIGYDIKITETWRSKEEQNALYNQVPKVTTVKYPYSAHCYGLAYDICLNDTKNPYPNDNKFWDEMGKIGEGLGLLWGGRWTNPVDRPHFQLKCYGEYGVDIVKAVGFPSEFSKATIWQLNKICNTLDKITTKSNKNQIVVFQAALNIIGFQCQITGKYDKETQRAYREFRMVKTNTWVKGGSVTKTGVQKVFKEAKFI